jgi:hypothetical protein
MTSRSAIALFITLASMVPIAASAIDVEVAKKCNALLQKQFPPKVPGNPAAGRSKGSARDQLGFFQKCVDNGGKVDSGDASQSKQ